MSPVKNVYEITINTRSGYKNRKKYESVFNLLFQTHEKDPVRLRMYFPTKRRKIYLIKNATVLDPIYSDTIQNNEVINGIKLRATDTLSYYIERIKPSLGTMNTDIGKSIKTIFKNYTQLQKFRVVTSLTKPKQIHFNGESTIKDILDNFCHQEDCHWCVAEDKLYIEKSIVINTKYSNKPLPGVYLGRNSLAKVWFQYKDEAGTTQSRTDFILNGDCIDEQFTLFDLKPGTIMSYDTHYSPYIYEGKGKLLITTVIPRFYGRSEAIIEGLVVKGNGERHHYRNLINKGVLNPRKRAQKRQESIIKSHINFPSHTVGEIVSGPTNGLYKVRIGQKTQDLTGQGNALNNSIIQSNLVLDNVPISSMFGETGTNTSSLTSGTRVLLAFNNNNLNDPIIIGIIQRGSTLPFIRTYSDGSIKISNPTGTAEVLIDDTGTVIVTGTDIRLGGISAVSGIARAGIDQAQTVFGPAPITPGSTTVKSV